MTKLHLTAVGNGFYRVKQEWLDQGKTVEEIAQFMCQVANQHVLEINDTYAWGLAEQAGLTVNDFYDDQDETIARYDEEAITHYGIVNYKFKKKDNEQDLPF